MRVNKIAATALLAVGATGLTTGVVHAQPTPSAAVSVRGVDQGVEYVTAPAVDASALITSVSTGSFRLTHDARSVILTNAAGQTVLSLPLLFQANGQTLGLTPEISNTGRTLTLTPVNAPANLIQDNAQLVSEADTLARKQHNAGVGALIGAGIGAVIGFFLGGVGALVTVPIGAGIGALIGFATP